MKTHIELITPIITEGIRTLDEVRPFERADLTITQCLIESGPASIESEFDEALCVPDTIRRAMEAQQRGANAIIIDCMGDPGLAACREVVTIPVVGPAQTAMHVASLLGHRFSFITVLERLRAVIDKLVAGYGLNDTYASFRAVDIPVLEIGKDLGALQKALAREADRGRTRGRRRCDRARLHGISRLRRRHAPGAARGRLRRAGDRPDSARRAHGRCAGEDRPVAQQARLSDAGQEEHQAATSFPEFNAGG